jgi:exodeoxyribonuclease-3
MKILAWNVNGLRACARKGFLEWLDQCGADIVAVQEVRARPEQLKRSLRRPDGWHAHFVSAERKGYSGVGLYSRVGPDAIETSLGDDSFDHEARLQIASFGLLALANVYFPNGSGPNRDHSRVPYKLDFYRRLFDRLEPAKAEGAPILVMGDFNTAHRPIDLARPKSNHKTSGFLPEERDELDRWLNSGWVDTFRYFHPEHSRYTWWSQRYGVRERNIGWRLDYVLASPGAMPFVEEAFILDDVMGSDHCPVGVEMAEGVVG